MQLGLTWPLQRSLKESVPYGEPIHLGLCWDAHCITPHGRSSLLLVHRESRYTCIRYDLSPMDWKRLEEIVGEKIHLCRCAGADDIDTAHAHLMRYFYVRDLVTKRF